MAVKGPQVGRKTVAARVREQLQLSSDREANNVVNVVTDSIVAEITAMTPMSSLLNFLVLANLKFATRRARRENDVRTINSSIGGLSAN